MTFAELETDIAELLKFDGDMMQDIVTPSGTADARVKTYISKFAIDTRYLWTPFASFNGTSAGDDTIDVDLEGATDRSGVVEIHELWLNNLLMTKITIQDMRSLRLGDQVPTAGTPVYYTQIRDSVVAINCPLSASAATAINVLDASGCSGWMRHPSINAGSQVLLIKDQHREALATYCAFRLMKSVVSDEVGAARMALYEEQSRVEMRAIRARNLCLYES